MEYNSFYGGRKGSSFVLAKSFGSMEEMITEFKKGNSYTTVAYDEYVLIDADNKSNPDNGKIFRRGYDSANELGGAIYIGQIVGPPGPPPHFELKTVEEVENVKIQNPDSIGGTGVYAPGDNLIPGKYEDAQGNAKYNDEIKWSYCSVMDPVKGETIAHVGFVFPYPVFEYEYELVDAYQSTNLMTRLDDKKHPFYEKWKLSIPKGVKGDELKNFRLIEATNSIQDYTGKADDVTNKRKVLVYDYYSYENNATGEPKTLYLGDYNMIDNITLNDEGTFTIDYSHDDTVTYNKLFKWIKSATLDGVSGKFTIEYNQATDANGTATKYETYLKYINSANVAADGTITFTYTNGEKTTFNKYIKSIKNVELNTETGHLTIDYNQETDASGKSTQYNTDLTWVKDIIVDEEGSVTLDYTTGDNKTYTKILKSISTVNLDADTGKFTVTYNQETDKDGNPTEYSTNLRWVKNVSVNDEGTIVFDYTNGADTTYTKYLKIIKNVELNNETGQFTVTYNHATDKDGNSTTYQTNLSWIKGMTLADDGTVKLQRSSGSEITLDNKIKWIKKTELNTGTVEGSGNQKLKITYNDNTSEEVGNPINYIMKTAFSDDFHFLVLYSDPAKRAAVVAAGENATHDGRNDWHDLGSVKDYDGVLIGKNITETDVPQVGTIDGAISYLNATYPNGLEGDNLTGKIVTVGNAEDGKLFFAFDYGKDSNGNYLGWYYIGGLETGGSVVAGKVSDSVTQSLVDQLPSNGIWFIVEE